MKTLAILVLMSLFCTVSWSRESVKIDFHSKELHSVQLLEEGIASLEARLQLIRKAQEFIDIETFILTPGHSSRLLMRALIDKKKSNPAIRIRILLDATPSHDLLDSYYAVELQRYGIELKLYNQFGFLDLNLRDHRKLFISENEAILGGRNLADEYYGLSSDFNFIDRDARVSGPIIKAMAWSFDVFWVSSKSESPKVVTSPNMEDYRSQNNKFSYEHSVPQTNDHPADIEKYKKAVELHFQKYKSAYNFISAELNEEEKRILNIVNTIGQIALDKQPDFNINNIRFVSDGPDWKKATAMATGPALIDLMENSTVRIIIENGYIIPDQQNWLTYINHLKAGKKMFVVTNSRKSAQKEFIVNALTLTHAKDLVVLGAKVFVMNGESDHTHEIPFPEYSKNAVYGTHAKSLIVDDEKCVVGTANFDPRSLKRLNAEMALIFESSQFCTHMGKMIEERARYSSELNSDGHALNKIDINQTQTLTQKTIMFFLPVIQIFEPWF